MPIKWQAFMVALWLDLVSSSSPDEVLNTILSISAQSGAIMKYCLLGTTQGDFLPSAACSMISRALVALSEPRVTWRIMLPLEALSNTQYREIVNLPSTWMTRLSSKENIGEPRIGIRKIRSAETEILLMFTNVSFKDTKGIAKYEQVRDERLVT